MDVGDASSWFLIPLQILLVDLLLGADNALVIALACRGLPSRQMREAAAIGVSGAVVIRTLLAVVATALLAIPLVKILGALALLVIAMNLVAGEDPGEDERPAAERGQGLWSAVAIILVADTAMSLDNVVALAAIARGNFWLLAIGVALSLPVLGYGGLILTRVLQHAPGLVAFGAALLGWIAGGMAISDPLVADWANVNAPGLVAIAPLLGAAFVYFQGRLAGRVAPKVAPAPELRAVVRTPAPTLAPVAPPPRLEDFSDDTPEPEGRVEAPRVPATRDDRVAIIGVLLIAIVAGVILMFASYYDSFQ